MRVLVLRLLYVLLLVFGLVMPQSAVFAGADETDLMFQVATPDFTLSAGGIAVSGYATIDTPGAPELPFFVKLVELPLYGEWQIAYEATGSYLLSGKHPIRSVPVPEQVAGSPTRLQDYGSGLPSVPVLDRPDPAIYGMDASYPEAPVLPGVEGCQRGRRLLPVRVFPFQYNPVTQEVLHHPQIKVTVHVSGTARGACSERVATSAAAAGVAATNASAGALHVRTSQRGMYSLTYSDLQGAGVPVDTVDPASFQMTLGGQTVQLQVLSGGTHSFAPGDKVIFYAEPYTGRWSASNVYRFSWGPTEAPAGSRMVTRSTAKTGELLTTITQLLHVERDKDYWSGYPISVEADHFFDSALSPNSTNPSVSATYDLALDDPVTVGTVRISGRVYGGKNQAVNPDQSFELGLNQQSVATHKWEGRVGYEFSSSTPATSLLASGNKLYLVAAVSQLSGISDYYIYPDQFDILYPALTEVEGDRAYVAGLQTDSTAVQLRFTGFSVPDPRVYDVRDPKSPVILATQEATASGGSYTVDVWDSWDPADGARQYALSSDNAMLKPVVEPDAPTRWKSPANSYDYIAIVHSTLATAVQPLLARRSQQGWRVAKVDVQDIYDEFNYGQRHQQAIRDFLDYAYHNWNQGEASPPQYVLLVGDGHYDFRNVLGTPVPNLVPPFLINIDPWIGETAADNRFVSVDSASDYLPDMSVGRIPAWNAGDVTAVVDKIAAYEDAIIQQDEPWQSRAVFVADDDENSAGNFHAFSEEVRTNWLPPAYESPTIYFNPNNIPAGVGYTTVGAMKTAVRQAFNDGALMMQWFGHASRFRWGVQDGLWKVWDVATLDANTRLPFTVSYSCWTGYFVNLFGYTTGAPTTPPIPEYQALGERHLLQPGRGAIADLSPSGQHVGSALLVLNEGLVKTIFGDRIAVLGEAVDAAKLYFYGHSLEWRDVIDTSVLFGDPALKLRLPRPLPTGSAEPPWVRIFPQSADSVLLEWDHLAENSAYEVYRSQRPYFQPDSTDSNRIANVPFVGSPVQYVDDGYDRDASDGTIPRVQVVGDVEHNYFWGVQGLAGTAGSDIINWVGEFDFALVKGN